MGPPFLDSRLGFQLHGSNDVGVGRVARPLRQFASRRFPTGMHELASSFCSRPFTDPLIPLRRRTGRDVKLLTLGDIYQWTQIENPLERRAALGQTGPGGGADLRVAVLVQRLLDQIDQPRLALQSCQQSDRIAADRAAGGRSGRYWLTRRRCGGGRGFALRGLAWGQPRRLLGIQGAANRFRSLAIEQSSKKCSKGNPKKHSNNQ